MYCSIFSEVFIKYKEETNDVNNFKMCGFHWFIISVP